ncbi:hypothetical protein [Dyella subtropica]|uniref:hypothetical protein n=1 Tax=Dyella subtropica TaxID=2992127 RepID=UPI00224D94A6|nr:hypothetical protein [Dyella subtropica]
MTRYARIGGRLTALAAVMTCIIAALAHAAYVHLYGVEVPYWDQWGAEGLYLLKPWAEGQLTWQHLVAPWNEHRIMFTRVISIALYEASGKTWSVLRTEYFNTFLYALIPSLMMMYVGRSDATRKEKALMALAIVTIAVLPYGWENTLGAFQNQFYLMILGTLAGVGLAAFGRPSIANLVVMVGIAATSILTMGPGIVAGPAIGLVLVSRAWLSRIPWTRALVTSAALLVVTSFGYLLTPQLPNQAALHAQDFRELIHALLITAGWPASSPRAGAVLIWLPALVGAWMIFRRRWDGTLDVLMLGLAAWTAVQIVEIAVSRGHGMAVVTPRYTDILVMGLLANLWFGIRVAGWTNAHPITALVRRIPVLLLVLVMTQGFLSSAPVDSANMAERRDQSLMQQTHVQAYLQTGIPAELDQPVPAIPLPDPAALRATLGDPTIRGMLITTPTSAQPMGTKISAH